MEAFVYSWSDHKTAKIYVGVHKGTPDDGYVCSSKPMKAEYVQRPEDFTRQIIAKGTFFDCRILESKINAQLIKNVDTTYNRSAWPTIVFDNNVRNKMQDAWVKRRQTPVSKETRLKMSIARSGKLKSKEQKEKMSIAGIGKPKSALHIEKMRINATKYACIINGIYYCSVSDASRKLGIGVTTIHFWLKFPNKERIKYPHITECRYANA